MALLVVNFKSTDFPTHKFSIIQVDAGNGRNASRDQVCRELHRIKTWREETEDL